MDRRSSDNWTLQGSSLRFLKHHSIADLARMGLLRVYSTPTPSQPSANARPYPPVRANGPSRSSLAKLAGSRRAGDFGALELAWDKEGVSKNEVPLGPARPVLAGSGGSLPSRHRSWKEFRVAPPRRSRRDDAAPPAPAPAEGRAQGDSAALGDASWLRRRQAKRRLTAAKQYRASLQAPTASAAAAAAAAAAAPVASELR